MLLFYTLIAIAINWVAQRKGFYRLPPSKGTPPLTFVQLIGAFGIFLLISLLLGRYLLLYILWSLNKSDPSITSLPPLLLTGVQLIITALSFFVLQLFMYQQNASSWRQVWKDRARVGCKAIEFDFAFGMLGWFLSFPIVTVINEGLETLLKRFFHLGSYEQVAVQFVKNAMASPFSLTFALLAIVVFAPLIEEFLFRGMLQTYFKRHLGVKAAILLSSLAFALFHFAPSQGLGNIPLLVSLFLLGGYLGFLYERQGSLWAPIGLHLTFNLFSALRILFFPEAI
jgi:uncharacterized protein